MHASQKLEVRVKIPVPDPKGGLVPIGRDIRLRPGTVWVRIPGPLLHSRSSLGGNQIPNLIGWVQILAAVPSPSSPTDKTVDYESTNRGSIPRKGTSLQGVNGSMSACRAEGAGSKPAEGVGTKLNW